MLLLLCRHADAGVPDPSRWPGDADRPLTDLGRATQRAMSQRVADAGMSPTVIVSSPLLRARQTAQVIAEVCGVTAPIEIAEALAQTPDIDGVSEAVAGVASAPIIALTGHSPGMDELASLLLTGARNNLHTQFSKSAIMAIRTDAVKVGAGELVAFFQP
jgi:phosphohistidine phosphatase